MSGKNKLVHKVDGDLTAFAESVARAENEAEAVLKKIVERSVELAEDREGGSLAG